MRTDGSTIAFLGIVAFKSFRIREKLGQMGKICHILPVGRGRIVTMSAMSEEAYQSRGRSRIRGRQRIHDLRNPANMESRQSDFPA